MNLQKVSFITALFFIFMTFSCCIHEKAEDTAKSQGEKPVNNMQAQVYTFESPQANQTFSPEANILIRIKKKDSAVSADSITFFLDGKVAGRISGGVIETNIVSKVNKPGIIRLRLTAYFTGGKSESTSIPLRFLSDIKPKQFTYRVLGTFPHDKRAYTQGFEYHDGYFLEGTGQLGQSSLRKITPGTGDIIKSRTLSSDLFGEGITMLNGKIYQLTYRSQVGFIYDAESFEQIQKFFYQNLEGWGLTNDGSQIIMSDGTNGIYFIDPQYFTVNRKIEVYNNFSEVDSLNELEYIDGKLYANRYMTDEIVIIDPSNGKVTGIVDMRGLLKPEDRHDYIDVLNGIAWDKDQKRLFVTGKNWPKVYRVELLEK